jgi:hypothetical protein
LRDPKSRLGSIWGPASKGSSFFRECGLPP